MTERYSTRTATPDSEIKKISRLKEIIAVLKANDIIHGTTPIKLRIILEELGPTFIKLGQLMSMRPDILPQSYCDELSHLRADVRPMDFQEIERIIEGECGVTYKELFRYIAPTPLGSASIAQVHKAVLQNGRKVVIKIQRRNIRKIMAEDIAIIRKAIGLVKIISGTGDALDFRDIIDEIWVAAQQEMDFLKEAAHLEEFAGLNSKINYIACPEVEKDLTTSGILVMEYIEGVPIDDLDTLRQMGYDLNEIGEKLAENYAKQVLNDAFFHADPHPGNIRICGGKIVWLDLGMMGRLSNRDQQLLKSTVKAIVRNDAYELKNVLLSMGVVKGKINHIGLYTDIDDMLTKYRQLDLAGLNLGQVFREISAIVGRHNISMPKGVAILGRGILTIEGLLALIRPKMNFVQFLADHMFQMMMEDFDVAKEVKQTVNRLFNSMNRSIDIPSYLATMLKMAVKGQTKVNLELIGADEPLVTINKMVDKMIIGLIDAAFLIGSSIICVTGMEPKILGIPILGVLGYFAAMILGVWLLYGIIFKSRR
jgi:ubiquinone biosynthesis protein